ncbi:Ig-like domain-containing protein, partial [Aquimarina litoralis]|uniref:Ig-like domain-containing protein n=1 Tax=Aquimarina litoralis TaxID=584605 RepID=UPI001C55BBD7
LDDPSFSFDQTTYCKEQANPTPSITGLTGGVFSGTTGLAIDPDSGIIDITNSNAGDYVVTYTTTGTCPNSNQTNVTITELDDPSFSYDQTIYCKEQSNPTPSITGLAGGMFSSTTGLIIDPDSGIIDIANSDSGDYIITYTTTGTCPNSSQVNVTISELDDPSFSYDQTIYCKGQANPMPSITGLTGGVFSSTTGLIIDPDSGVIDIGNSDSGNHVVTYTTTGTCPNSSQINLTITELDDPSFSYDQTIYCKEQSNPTPSIAGLTGGVFSSTTGLVIDPDSGIIDIANSDAGDYTVTYTTTGTCPNSSQVDVTISELDDPSFSFDQTTYCKEQANPTPSITGLTGGVFSGTTGLAIDPDSGIIDITNSNAGDYVVTYTTTGTCPNSSQVNVTITELDDPSFSFDQTIYCKGQANPTPSITGLTGGVFSSTTGLAIDPDSGIIDITNSNAGDYIVTYTTTGTCPNSSQVNVTISELDDPSFSYDQTIYCKDQTNPTPSITGLTGGVFSSTTGLAIDPDSGIIDITNSDAGDYTVTYTTTGTCPNSSQVNVTISELDDPSFSFDQTIYCKDQANPTPSIAGLTGGVFSSTTGLAIDPDSGIIDVANSDAGDYTVTYITTGTCPSFSNFDITINDLDDASFLYTESSFSTDDPNPIPLITGITGGVFTSLPTGLVINNSTGEIDLTNSIPNTYTITYTTARTCTNSSSVSIVVIDNTPPTASITSSEANPTGNSSFEITITFDEDITDFDLNDIRIENGIVSNFSGGGLSYQATVTATTAGTITINIDPGSFTDLYGNENDMITEFVINFDNTLGITDENTLKNITIYPIPSKNTVNILSEINSNLEKVEFFDVRGKLILSKVLNRGSISNSIDISTFHSGLYLMKIFSETGSITKKILKE